MRQRSGSKKLDVGIRGNVRGVAYCSISRRAYAYERTSLIMRSAEERITACEKCCRAGSICRKIASDIDDIEEISLRWKLTDVRSRNQVRVILPVTVLVQEVQVNVGDY